MNESIIGGVGLTHLKVYEVRSAPDGKHSGCAHVHAVTDEAYYVIGGTGAVELHDPEQGFRSVPLAKGSYVCFSPGVLHRAVSTGGLEVLAVMGNAGLAERGDARVYFGAAVDADPDAYSRLMALPAEKGLAGALERRDASVKAYLDLLRLWETDREAYRAELRRFSAVHQHVIEARRAEFETVVAGGPRLWAETVAGRLAALPDAFDPTMAVGADQERGGPRLGMCGILHQIERPTRL